MTKIATVMLVTEVIKQKFCCTHQICSIEKIRHILLEYFYLAGNCPVCGSKVTLLEASRNKGFCSNDHYKNFSRRSYTLIKPYINQHPHSTYRIDDDDNGLNYRNILKGRNFDQMIKLPIPVQITNSETSTIGKITPVLIATQNIGESHG